MCIFQVNKLNLKEVKELAKFTQQVYDWIWTWAHFGTNPMLLNTELSSASPCTSFVFQDMDHVSTISSQGKKEVRHATHRTGDDAWCCLGLSEKTLDIFFEKVSESFIPTSVNITV